MGAARPACIRRALPGLHASLDVLNQIAATLDSLKVALTYITPFGSANAGEADLICDFVVRIGVKPHSPAYADAVAAGNAVHEYFAGLGIPDMQVAFVESVFQCYGYGPGTKLPSFDPLLDDLPALRVPFTTTLYIAIAPHKTSHFGGTGALYFRLSSKTDDVTLFTCAHVIRPLAPPRTITQGLRGRRAVDSLSKISSRLAPERTTAQSTPLGRLLGSR